jgi:hypothetical protein
MRVPLEGPPTRMTPLVTVFAAMVVEWMSEEDQDQEAKILGCGTRRHERGRLLRRDADHCQVRPGKVGTVPVPGRVRLGFGGFGRILIRRGLGLVVV